MKYISCRRQFLLVVIACVYIELDNKRLNCGWYDSIVCSSGNAARRLS